MLHKMKLPRFNAESSLCGGIKAYQMAGIHHTPGGSRRLLPQLMEQTPRECYIECRLNGGDRTTCRDECRPPIYV